MNIGLLVLGARVMARQNQAEFAVGLGVRGHIATSTLSRWEHLEAQPLPVLVDLAFIPAMRRQHGEAWESVIGSDPRARLAMQIRALAHKKGVKDYMSHKSDEGDLQAELLRVTNVKKGGK